MRRDLDPREQARVESLLRAAAEFEPEGGFAPELYLPARRARSRRHASGLTGVITAAAVAGCLLLANLHAPHKAPVAPVIPSVNIASAPQQSTPATHTAPVITVAEHLQKKRPKPKFAILPVRHQQHGLNLRMRLVRAVPGVPKVRWHNETVLVYARGVMQPGWMVHKDDSDDSLVAEPAVLSVPIQGAEIPVRHGANIRPGFQLTGLESHTEENP